MTAQRVVNTTLAVGSTAVALAHTFGGGAPFAVPVIVLLGELARCCDEVQIYKVRH